MVRALARASSAPGIRRQEVTRMTVRSALERQDGRVVSVGECMVELARGADGRFDLAFGGDTFNTAVYLARAGIPVAYATALGDDPYSGGIASLAREEQVAGDLVQVLPGRMPGLYLIETSNGERSFWYWRDRAAARDLFEADHAAAAMRGIESAAVVYFSGVTLSIYSDAGRDRLAQALSTARDRGAIIVMDSNYRARGWQGDKERARRVFERFWRLSQIAMPTFEDEQTLWGDSSPEATLSRFAAMGVAETVIKLGADGAAIQTGSACEHIATPHRAKPVDTTGAGDAFDAAYLAARLRGLEPHEAALIGHDLAAIVVQHRGAIVPRSATEAVLNRPPFTA
jgi:2-dehydro-3-deoxygluconokinase